MSAPFQDIETYSGVPVRLAEFKEELGVLAMRARDEYMPFVGRTKFSAKEAALLACCGEQTIRDAGKDGRLEMGTSGWITLPALIKFLGYDPIQERIRQVKEFEHRAAEIAQIIETLLRKPIENPQEVLDSVLEVQPTA